ncbi:hypothetical protein Lepto7375DRAFT_7227 [Leptolyngbya sp. PCC 7375]|nr:hypothetical protein Lepto7375DRAFT_7227 [Leptolyngbya sp. PCC 7375]
MCGGIANSCAKIVNKLIQLIMTLVIIKATWYAYAISPDQKLRYEIGIISSLPQAVKEADEYCDFIQAETLKPVNWKYEGDQTSLRIAGPVRY